jgi:hypothetical protein
VIVVDEAPRLAARNTSKGRAEVNTAVFDAKVEYRGWTGGGHRIHATNTSAEAEHDLMLLLGERPSSFLQASWDGCIPRLQRELSGAHGWHDLGELFQVLNACVPYAVLRNFQNLPLELPSKEHPDIDLLVKDQRECAFVGNARKVHGSSARAMFEMRVSGEWIPFDLRYVGDGYYDERWQSGMLRRRALRSGVFVLGHEDHVPALLYHSLVHKEQWRAGSRTALLALAAADGFAFGELPTRGEAMAWLCGFMSRNRYDFTMPKDHSVAFNLDGIPLVRTDPRLSIPRHVRGVAREVTRELLHRLGR